MIWYDFLFSFAREKKRRRRQVCHWSVQFVFGSVTISNGYIDLYKI